MEPFKKIGTWWFADNPNFKFTAELDFDPQKGALLRPTDAASFSVYVINKYGRQIGNLNMWVGFELIQCPPINGFSNNANFSLLHCQLNTQLVAVGVVVEGTHFETVEEANFASYQFHFSGLDEWGASGRLLGKRKINHDDSSDFELQYRMPPWNEEAVIVELETEILEIGHSIHLDIDPSYNRGSLIEGTFFRVVSKSGGVLSVTEAVETYSNMLRNFLMLATWRFVKPLSVKAELADDEGTRHCNLYWSGKGAGQPTPKYSFSDWFFTLRDLGEKFVPVFQTWARDYAKFQPLTRNYLAYRYTKDAYLEARFLAYMQALDGYARSRRIVTGRPPIKNVLIKVFNTVSHYPAFSKIIKQDEVSSFGERLADIRNTLTHEADLLEDVKLIDLVRANQKLELIMLLLIYHALGFPDDLIERISNTSPFLNRM